jgi:hypothetical protein
METDKEDMIGGTTRDTTREDNHSLYRETALLPPVDA